MGVTLVSTNTTPVSACSPTRRGCEPSVIPRHLPRLSLALLAAQNGSTASCSSLHTLSTVSPCSVVSSACWWLQGAADPSGRRMLDTAPSRCSCRHFAANGCAAMTYSSGLRGLPCAQPEGMSNSLLACPPLKTT